MQTPSVLSDCLQKPTTYSQKNPLIMQSLFSVKLLYCVFGPNTIYDSSKVSFKTVLLRNGIYEGIVHFKTSFWKSRRMKITDGTYASM